MTITEPDLRAALQRAVDQADLEVAPLTEPRGRHLPARPAARRRGVLAAAAVLVALVAVAVVARSGSQSVRTDRGHSPSARGTTTAPTTAAGTVAPDPSSLRILVLNGGDTPFHAGTLTDQLGAAGYQTLPPDNARDRVDPTLVYFAPREEVAALDLAFRIGRPGTPPRPLPVRPLGVSTREAADLVIVIGRDWTPGPLEVPGPGATYSTTTAPAPAPAPEFVLWKGGAGDAAKRATPEGALRALVAAIDPAIAVEDVTVTAGSHAGWQTVTARVGGTVYVEAATSPSDDGWVISGLDDVDHLDLSTSAALWPDGRLVVGTPTGTETAVVYDLALDPVRREQFPDPGVVASLPEAMDQPAVGFEFAGPADAGVADHLLIGWDATGAITTLRAFKIGP